MADREITCIRCPVGCRMKVSVQDGQVTIGENGCARGSSYGKQEFLAPVRTVTSSVRLTDGIRPLCPVKTDGDIPKSMIAAVLGKVHQARVAAPVEIGQVIIRNVADTGVDIVATDNAK